jgi:membrane protein implicated in regulation of membrane protease activity
VPGWAVWLIIAAAFVVGEVATTGLFVLGPIALAAIAAAGVAGAGVGVAFELVVFIGGSVLSLGLLRPVARRHLSMPAHVRTGTAALVGARALVLERVDAHSGRIKIGGEEWSARSYVEGGVYEPGVTVEVAKIEGATAFVYE